MHSIKTPDSCFQNLQDFPFLPNYQTIEDGDVGELTMHYVEEGPLDGPLILCVHGQPVWSYSFRKMIPPLTDAGYRVVVPDIVGFGRSDKPTNPEDYTFANHVKWMRDFIRRKDLSEITLVCQDWGGCDLAKDSCF